MFEPVRKLRVAEQVAAAIRDAILGGEIPPGDPLPAERDLATRFGVNRSSVREALHRLDAWGLVEIRQGGATRVRNFLAGAGLHLLPFLVAPGGTVDPVILGDLLSVRAMLLAWTARAAAEHASDGDAAHLDASVDRLAEATDPAEIQRLDFDFFERLVALTGNRVLRMLANAVRQVYLANAELFQVLYAGGPLDVTHHRETVTAVRAGDGRAAADAMEAYARAGMKVVAP